MKGIIKSLFAAFFLTVCYSSSATEIDNNTYDIYVGDLNSDGNSDFYFQGKPSVLILFGDISVPLIITPANLAIMGTGGSYGDPQLYSLSPVDLSIRVSNGSMRLMQKGTDYYVWDNGAQGQNVVLLRGATASSPALSLTSYSAVALPLVSVLGNANFPGISDRSVPISFNDINKDGLLDIVLGSASDGKGQMAYILDILGAPATRLELAPVTSSPTTSGSAKDGNQVGSLVGQFRVSESGAATYGISIAMADGVAGVKPQISLAYGSQAGNGLLGKGWSLGGLSAISRCRQTLSQDGVAKPMSWTADDRFCLDGQRLMLTSGSYGVAGSTYKTEIDSFVTVTAVGGIAGHPDYFTVTAKDGSTSVYGDSGLDNSELSARDANGAVVANRVLTWSIKRFRDNVGNSILYIYDSTANYQNIKEIRYA